MSRKQKAYRAWHHKANAEEMNVQTAFEAGWDAHKGVAHARTIQELQAENDRLRSKVEQYKHTSTQAPAPTTATAPTSEAT